MILSMAQCECGSQKTLILLIGLAYSHIQYNLVSSNFLVVQFTSYAFEVLPLITSFALLGSHYNNLVVYLAIDSFILNYPCFFNYSHHPKIDGVIASCVHFNETKVNITIFLKFPQVRVEKVNSNLEKKGWDHISNSVFKFRDNMGS